MGEKKYHKVNAKIFASYGYDYTVPFWVDGLKVALDNDGEVNNREIMMAFNELVRVATSCYGREAGTTYMEVDSPLSGAFVISLDRVNYFGLDDWQDMGEWKEEE